MEKWKMDDRGSCLKICRYLIGIAAIVFALALMPVYAIGGNGKYQGGSGSKGGKDNPEIGAAGEVKGKGGSGGKQGTSGSKGHADTKSSSSTTANDNSDSSSKGNKSENGRGRSKERSKGHDTSDQGASVGGKNDDHGAGQGYAGGSDDNGGGHAASGNKGKRSGTVAHGESDNEDSDRPVWAGKNGDHAQKPGGGNHGADTKKGGDYGDLFVMSRADDGTLLEYYEDGTPCEDGDSDCYPAALLFDTEGNVIDIFVLSPDAEPPESVEEVELGRLNISRAPSKVLAHALAEVLSKLDGLTVSLENLNVVTDLSGRLLIEGTAIAIDSPLENLSLYQAILEGYETLEYGDSLVVKSGANSITIEWEAIPYVATAALAAASDKTDIMEIDKVSYLSKFLDVETTLNSLVEDYDNWYDPEMLYGGVNLSVMTFEDDDDDPNTPPVASWETVNLLEDVDIYNDIREIEDDGNGIDVFTQATDNALQVIEYLHDNMFVVVE